MKRVYFKDNTIPYGQDFSWFKGIPSYIIFEIDEKLPFQDGTTIWLKAPGYGKDPYGNGSLAINKSDFTKKNKKIVWIK